MAYFAKSPWDIHYDASSCNGCDIEVLAALSRPASRRRALRRDQHRQLSYRRHLPGHNEQNISVVKEDSRTDTEPKVVVACGIRAPSGGIFHDCCYRHRRRRSGAIPVDCVQAWLRASRSSSPWSSRPWHSERSVPQWQREGGAAPWQYPHSTRRSGRRVRSRPSVCRRRRHCACAGARRQHEAGIDAQHTFQKDGALRFNIVSTILSIEPTATLPQFSRTRDPRLVRPRHGHRLGGTSCDGAASFSAATAAAAAPQRSRPSAPARRLRPTPASSRPIPMPRVRSQAWLLRRTPRTSS